MGKREPRRIQSILTRIKSPCLQTLGKLAQHPGTAETVKVVVSHAKNEHDAVERQWHGFRYICKQLEPEPEPKWGIPEDLDVIVDDSIEEQAEVYLEGGDHATLVHLSHAQFARFTAEALTPCLQARC